ncbi:MAG: hypothetical protein WC700_14305 [Gemmatimonadaceae bacterium]
MAYRRYTPRRTHGLTDPAASEEESIRERLAEIAASGGIPRGLTDAYMDVSAPLRGAATTGAAWFQKLFGPAAVLGAGNAAVFYNAMDSATHGGTQTPGLVDWLTAGYRSNPITEPIANAVLGGGTSKRKSVLGEMGKALHGDQFVSTTDAIKDFVAPQAARTGKRPFTSAERGRGPLWWLTHPAATAQDPVLQMIAGTGGDILIDPATYVGVGAPGRVKVAADTGAKAIMDAGLTTDRVLDLERAGLKVSENLPEINQLISRTKETAEMSPRLQRNVMTALRREAATAQKVPLGLHIAGTEVGNLQPALEGITRGGKEFLRKIGFDRIENALGSSAVVTKAAQEGREMSAAAMKIAKRQAAGAAQVRAREGVLWGTRAVEDVPDKLRAASKPAVDYATQPYREASALLHTELDDIAKQIRDAGALHRAQSTMRAAKRAGLIGETGRVAERVAQESAPAAQSMLGQSWVATTAKHMGFAEQRAAAEAAGVAGSGAGQLIDDVKGVLGGRYVTDRSRLTAEAMQAARTGEKVAAAGENSVWRSAGFKTKMDRLAENGMGTDQILEALHEAHPGVYDHIDDINALEDAVSEAAAHAARAKYQKARVPGAAAATPESVLRAAREDPDSVRDALAAELQDTIRANDELAYDAVMAQDDEFTRWLDRTGIESRPKTVIPERTVLPMAKTADSLRDRALHGLQMAALDKLDEIRGVADTVLKPTFAPRLREFAVEVQHFTPQEADALVKHVLDDITPAMDKMYEAMEAARVPETARYGAKGMGYFKQMPRPEQTGMESFVNKLLRRNANPTDDELRALGWRAEGLRQPAEYAPVQGGTVHARSTPSAELPTAEAWNKAGLDIQLDSAVVIPEKIASVGRQEGKVILEDNFVRNFSVAPPSGLPPASVDEWRKVNGMAEFKVSRNGITQTHYVPNDYAAAFDQSVKPFITDKSLTKLGRDYDSILSAWKRMATTYNPGFHGRNLMSNLLLLHSEGIGQADGVSYGMGLVHRDLIGKLDAKTIKDFGTFGKMTEAEFMDIMREQAVRTSGFARADATKAIAQQVRENASPWRKVTAKGVPVTSLRGTMEHAGEVVEDGMRVGGVINAARQGLDPTSAADLAIRAMYDYSATATNAFEKSVVQRLIPFWKWQKANIPHMAEWALKNIGQANVLTHLRNAGAAATDTDLGLLPEYAKEGGYIPIPGADGQTLLLNPNVPLQDLGKLEPTPSGMMQWLSQGMTPPIKVAVEAGLFNQSSFTGLPISQQGRYTPVEWLPGSTQLAGLLGPGKQGGPFRTQIDPDTGRTYLAMEPYTNYALQAASPFLTNLGKSVNPLTQDQGYKAMSWLTGVKLAPANKTKMYVDALKARDQELADQQAQMRDMGLLPPTKAQETRRRQRALINGSR